MSRNKFLAVCGRVVPATGADIQEAVQIERVAPATLQHWSNVGLTAFINGHWVLTAQGVEFWTCQRQNNNQTTTRPLK